MLRPRPRCLATLPPAMPANSRRRAAACLPLAAARPFTPYCCCSAACRRQAGRPARGDLAADGNAKLADHFTAAPASAPSRCPPIAADRQPHHGAPTRRCAETPPAIMRRRRCCQIGHACFPRCPASRRLPVSAPRPCATAIMAGAPGLSVFRADDLVRLRAPGAGLMPDPADERSWPRSTPMPALRQGLSATAAWGRHVPEVLRFWASGWSSSSSWMATVLPRPMSAAPSPPPTEAHPRPPFARTSRLRAHGTAVRHAVRRRHGQLRGRATTPSAPARSSPGRRSSPMPSPSGPCGEGWKEIVAGAKAGADGSQLHRPVLRRQRAQPHRPPGRWSLRSEEKASRPCASMRCLDGRDVPETSALDYVVPFEAFLPSQRRQLRCPHRLGGGRQTITMDRYDANWPMVDRGWKTHVLGEGPQFANATDAVRPARKASRHHRPGSAPDSSSPRDGKPSAPSSTATRWCSSTSAATAPSRSRAPSRRRLHDKFDRGRAPAGDLPPACCSTTATKRPALPWSCRRPSTAPRASGSARWAWPSSPAPRPEVRPRHLLLERQPLRQVRRQDLATPGSPTSCPSSSALDEAAEITDAIIAALQSGRYKVLRVQLRQRRHGQPHRQLPGRHLAIEAVDLAGAPLPVIDAAGGGALITADHGNADEMFELDKKTRQPAQNKDGSFKAKTARQGFQSEPSIDREDDPCCMGHPRPPAPGVGDFVPVVALLFVRLSGIGRQFAKSRRYSLANRRSARSPIVPRYPTSLPEPDQPAPGVPGTPFQPSCLET